MRAGLLLLLGTVALVGDGGPGPPTAPPGPVTAAPPFGTEAPLASLERAMYAGQARRAVAGFAGRLVDDPTDLEAAVGLARASILASTPEWLDAFLTALRRRLPTAAVELAGAEIAYRRGDRVGGLEASRRAFRRQPTAPSVRLALAVGLASGGDVLGAFGVVPELGQRGSFPVSVRAAGLQVAVQPGAAGSAAVTRAWRQTLRASRSDDRISVGLLLASLDESAGRPAAARRLVERATRDGLAMGRGVPTGMAMLRLAENSDAATGGHDLMTAACRYLTRMHAGFHRDCLLAVLDREWRRGNVASALQVYRRLGAAVADDAVLLMRTASVALPLLQTVGRVDEAIRLADRAARRAERVASSGLQGGYLVRLAALHRRRGDVAAAELASRRALQLAEGGPTDGWIAALLGHAESRRAVGDVEGALDAVSRAEQLASLARPRESRSLSWRAAELQLWVAAGRLASAAAPLRASRPEALLAELLRGRQAEGEADTEAAVASYRAAIGMLRSWLQQPDEPAQGWRLAELSHGLVRRAAVLALNAGRARLALEILEERHRDVGDAADRSPTVELLRGRLGYGAAVVAYVVGAEEVWAIVVRDGAARGIRLPVDASGLDGAIGLWQAAVVQGAPRPVRQRIDERLARAVLWPVVRQGLLEGVQTVYVIPDGPLHAVPLAALPDSTATERAGQRTKAVELGMPSAPAFGDRRAVARVPSLGALHRSIGMTPRRGPTVVFAPSGGPDTAVEARAAIAISPNGLVLRGPRASETLWGRLSARAATLHFAGHSEPPTGGLDRGGLVLRGDGLADGTLTVREALALDLAGASVVLLGCDTAARPRFGERLSGELPSLGEAFLHAGARSVVGNLWAISERDARRLAVAFYEEGGTAAGAAALTRARRRLRNLFPESTVTWAGAVWYGAAEAAPGGAS